MLEQALRERPHVCPVEMPYPPTPWHHQLTMRGFAVAGVLGVVFCIITIKLNLGSAGMTPSLNIAGGLLSYCLLKALSQLSSKCNNSSDASSMSLLGAQFIAFSPQENAVVQTMTSACYSLAGYSGFGSYLLAMSYQAYLNAGGVPKGQPGYKQDAVIDPSLQRVYPYLLLIAFAGVFALLGLRNLLIVTWRLPYPSGTASGVMINSLHGKDDAAASASRNMKVMGWTALGSFLFDALKWVFQGPNYQCGFASLPTFGSAAMKWTWHFDFQQQYIGAGMLVPHIVAWSMMLGAVLSWGVMWPLLAKREGAWYPAGLDGANMKGLAGYKIWLSVALLLGEGCYIMIKAVMLGIRHARSLAQATSVQMQTAEALLPAADKDHSSHDMHSCKDACALIDTSTQCTEASSTCVNDACHNVHAQHGEKLLEQQQQQHCCLRHRGSSITAGQAVSAASGQSTAELAEAHSQAGGGFAGIAFKETRPELKLREQVFLSCHIPWWMGPCGYCAIAVLSIICLPLLYPPARWYMVLVAYGLGPPIALANSYGAGLTDQDNGANFATLALFLFAGWAGSEGTGVVAGCVLMGVVMVCAVTAAILMQDFRTAYITCTHPTAMFIAQLLGTAMGVVFAPLVFMMFWRTGLVGHKNGPYPNPFADVSRGIAVIGTEGLSALPKYCDILAVAFFAAGVLLCTIRDTLPAKYGRFVPSPMGMAFSLYIGANNAIDFFIGSLIMLIWEQQRLPSSSLGAVVGAGLIVGDGLWAIPGALLSIVNVAPPLCLKIG